MPLPHIISVPMAVATLLACIAGVQVLGLPRFTEARSGRLAAIDGLRGFLALLVFLQHFYETYHYRTTGEWVVPSSAVFKLFGTASVTLFFMITGFLFFGKIKAVHGRVDLNRFYLGRVFRIVPVYAVSVVLVYLITFIETGFHIDRTMQASLDQWVFFHAAVINEYPASPLINAGVIWTLTYEWVFYFSVPVVAALWSKLHLQSWAVGLAAVLALYFQRNDVEIPYLGLASGQFAPFVLGGLAGEMGRIAPLRRFAASRWGGAVSVAALVVLFGCFSVAYSVSAYLVLFAFFVPIALGNPLFGLLRLRAVNFLGEISYGIYMLNGIVLFALFTVAMPDVLQGVRTQGQMLLLMLLAAGGVVASSLAIHLAVERPLLQLGRKLVPIDSVQVLAAP